MVPPFTAFTRRTALLFGLMLAMAPAIAWAECVVTDQIGQTVTLPEKLAPDIVYGLCRAPGAGAAAALFIWFLLSRTGQAMLADNGFRPADGWVARP